MQAPEKVIHIEPSSRCTIGCPQCPRTYHKGEYNVGDCDIESMAKMCAHFDKVFMCGNHGDPIYHGRFHELIAALRSANQNVRISMNTNGSHRSEDWWARLGPMMHHQGDNITFSIDGMPHDNHIYRVGSDWSSIETGIRTLRRTNHALHLKWKWIVFRYNQDEIGHGMRLARDLGFNAFQVVWSDRYKEDDPLTPTRTYEDILAEVDECHRYFHAA